MGFQPDVIIVQGDGADGGWAYTSTMGTDVKLLGTNSALSSDYISSIDVGGFTVKTAGNVDGDTYYFLAFDDADGAIDVGSIVGSASTQDIDVGYEPQNVWVFGDRGNYADYSIFMFGNDDANPYQFTTTDPQPGFAKIVEPNMNADGFTLAANGDGTATGTTYHYVTFDASADVANGSYVGNETARSIDVSGGAAWAPDFMFTKASNNYEMLFKTSLMPSGTAWQFDGTARSGSVLDLTTTGFDLGTDVRSNANSQTNYYSAY